jgi:hypothetical protein
MSIIKALKTLLAISVLTLFLGDGTPIETDGRQTDIWEKRDIEIERLYSSV